MDREPTVTVKQVTLLATMGRVYFCKIIGKRAKSAFSCKKFP
jgi:hypothetical protein